MSEAPEDADDFLSAWLRSGLAALAITLALAGGALALLLTPREEEPQIDVPLIDVFVRAPGLSAAEIERRVVWPMEQTLFGTRGVEYVYSTSVRDGAIITARFYVGESPVDSEVHVRNRLERNRHRYPAELEGYQIRPVYVDDVPFMTLTLHSATVDEAGLLSLAEEYLYGLTGIEGVGLVFVVGGRNEAITIELDPQRMAAHGVTLGDLREAVAGNNTRVSAGDLVAGDRRRALVVGRPLGGVDGLRELVVAVEDGATVQLGDVAVLREGLLDARQHAFFARGPAAAAGDGGTGTSLIDRSAVTLALSKRPDANAVEVSARVHEMVADLESALGAAEVELDVTRDYGRSADDAVDWLVASLAGASIVVMAVLAVSLGFREALIVAVSVPTTFALALLVNYLADFSLNRVTLFALIVALGLIVDDSIVSIDNIHRYLTTAAGRGRSRLGRIAAAVREVLPPMLLTSLVVVLSFVPLAFMTGLMGPYMQPMAVTVPVAMLASTAVAALVVPWLALLVLRSSPGSAAPEDTDERSGEASGAPSEEAVEDTALYRAYARVVAPFLDDRRRAAGLFCGLLAAFALALAIPLLQWIPLKLLPFDDTEKLQLVIEQDADATLERTVALVDSLGDFLLRQREVVDVTAYAGDASPVDFNGLVRGYYLREGPAVGDIRVNVVEGDRRQHSSNQLALRFRDGIDAIEERFGAVVKTVQRPPGPPVLAPVVAEVRAPPAMSYAELVASARRVQAIFDAADGVLDVDSSLEAEVPRWEFLVDRRRAALVGLTPAAVGELVAGALRGVDLSRLLEPGEIRPRPLRLRLPRAFRDDPSRIADMPVFRSDGRYLTVGELGHFERTTAAQTIERKNLRRVVYVTADVAGRTPTDAVFALGAEVERWKARGEIDPRVEVSFGGEGEWFITRRAFRDLGLALGVAVLAIYALLVYQTGSYLISLILLTSIPLTLIGIMPGFWLLNALATTETAGYAIGVPFTATGMIGIVALAGIAVRNAILLIDFTVRREAEGMAVREALLQAGALRTRPILLTAGTAMLAVVPIAFDPVFAGLAWSLIFGLLVSTLFTLVLVPTLYHRLMT